MARRRRYSRRHSQGYDTGDKILLAEFKFYNKQTKILSNEVLNRVTKQLETDKVVFWTNEDFSQNNVGFEFTKETKTINKKDKTDIYVRMLKFKFPFKAEMFNKAVDIYDKFLFIGFNLDLKQSTLLENIFENLGYSLEGTLHKFYEKEEPKLLNDWQSVVDFLIKTELLSNYQDTRYSSTFKEDVKLVLDVEYEKPNYEVDKYRYGRIDTYHIFKVIEKRIGKTNYRIALVSGFEYGDSEYFFKVFSDKSEFYTAIDEGRIYFTSDNKKYFLDIQINKMCGDKVFIPGEAIKLLKNDINNLLAQGEYIVNPRIFRFYEERGERFSGEHIPNILDKISTQYKLLLGNNKTIKLENVVINKTSIQIDDFLMEFSEDFINVPDNIGRIRDLVKSADMRYNFNELYDKLLKLSALRVVSRENTGETRYKKFEEAKYKINGKEIVVKKESNRIKVNGIFCRIDDLFFILSRAVCYENLDDYEKFIKDVSFIGAEWLKMINTGVALELTNPFYSTFKNVSEKSISKFYMRFSLFWDMKKRNNVYLMLNGEKYLIKYKGKFKQFFNMPHRTLTMSQLKNELDMCILDLDDEEFIKIIENAIQEAKIIKERGDELVANTIKEIEAKKIELEFQGGKHIGFIFKGKKSGGEYFVKESDLSVYKKLDGEWNRRCIVDDSSKQRIFEDRLANRLVNIANEPNYLDRFLAV